VSILIIILCVHVRDRSRCVGKGVVMSVWLLVNGCVCTRVSKREKERDTRRDRQADNRQSETDRQTEKKIETNRERDIDIETDR